MKNVKIITAILTISMSIMSCTNTKVKQEAPINSSTSNTDKYTELNQRVRKAGNINTPVELVKYYYGEIDDEQDIDISVDKFDNNQYKIMLIQENIKDDSIAGMRVIMLAKKDNNEWTVIDIQRTWKCQKGRGHSNFSSEPCI